ncbi:hypothetical protein Tco_0596455 [Tanacetum coccineum]
MLVMFRFYVKFHGVPMASFSEDGLSVIVTKLGTLLMFDSYTSDICMQSLDMSSYARAMIELRADMELKDTIVVFGHGLDECPKKIISDVVKNLKNPRQDKLLEVFSSVGKGAKYGMFTSNHGTLHVASSSVSTTLIAERIDKFERQMIEGKLLLVDDDGKSLPKSVSTVNVNCDSEVEEVFNEHIGFMTSTTLKSGSESEYGTKSLLEQLRETKRDDDYNPYDDDMYHSLDMSQVICDDFDITVCGRKKK